MKERAETEEFRLGRTMQNIANRFRRLADENLARRGITSTQVHVLAYISRHDEKGGVPQKDLETAFQIRRSSVSAVISNMEKGGWITRTGAEGDGRVKILSLTEKGKKLDRELIGYMKELEEELIGAFEPEERELFREYLTRAGEKLSEIERRAGC